MTGPGFILLTYWCLIVPFIVLGGSGVFGAFGDSWRTVRGYAWRVFGTYVLVFLILIAFAVVLGLILALLPVWLRSFVNNLVSGTLIAPFLALVATLIYYRLTAAHAGQPYISTGPAGATVPEPPYPTMPAGPADSPRPAPSGPGTGPGGTRPGGTGPRGTGFDEAVSPRARSDGAPASSPTGPGLRRAASSGHLLILPPGHRTS